jgi:16S rRNA (uracil1498-N3)-methyltransferase
MSSDHGTAGAGRSPARLFVEADLRDGAALPLAREQMNYVVNVLRLGPGAAVLAFNGRDGEWLTEVVPVGRRDIVLRVLRQTRLQPARGDLRYLFAPLKSARLDYLAQKAVEMGATTLEPVMTHRTQASRVNLDRLRANAIEAAEQCGILALPEVVEEAKLPRALASLEPSRRLIFCDEDAPLANPSMALAGLAGAPLALLIGPEGGFDETERRMLAGHPGVVRLSLGPRILRADTAAVAALAIIQSSLGDWR